MVMIEVLSTILHTLTSALQKKLVFIFLENYARLLLIFALVLQPVYCLLEDISQEITTFLFIWRVFVFCYIQNT